MDKLTSPFLKSFVKSLEPEKDDLHPDRVALAEKLYQAQNCCYNCFRLWTDILVVVDEQTTKAFRALHPSKLALQKNYNLSKLADDFIQKDDHFNLSTALSIAKPADKSWLEKIRVLLTNHNPLEPAEKAAIHIFVNSLVKGALTTFHQDQIRKLILKRSTKYKSFSSSLYPFRNTDGSSIKITKVNKESQETSSGKVYLSCNVKPFISSKLSPDARINLHQNIGVIKNSRGHIFLDEIISSEKKGNFMPVAPGVIALTEICKDSCLGIQSGIHIDSSLLSFPEFFIVNNLINMAIEPGENFYIDCDGAMSKIKKYASATDNIWYEYAPDDEINVEEVYFEAELINGKRVFITAIFAMRDIRAGEELCLRLVDTDDTDDTVDTTKDKASLDVADEYSKEEE